MIENPENSEEIGELIQNSIKNREILHSAITYNDKNVKPHLERDYIKKKVIACYKRVENDLDAEDI